MIFSRYLGIDYSGAQTPIASLKGLRVYVAEGEAAPVEVLPRPSPPVDVVHDGAVGNGAARMGDPRWRRLTPLARRHD